MTTVAQLRKAALALPEVEEGTRSGLLAHTVRGRGFASVTKDGLVQLRLPRDETEAAGAAHPSGERVPRGGATIGFRVPLADIDGKDLNALVRASWFSRAPKRLAASLAAAEAAAGSPAGDLPVGIGRPATRALFGAGVTTLDTLAGHSEAELRALHGVGPKAVRILSEAPAERGRALGEGPAQETDTRKPTPAPPPPPTPPPRRKTAPLPPHGRTGAAGAVWRKPSLRG